MEIDHLDIEGVRWPHQRIPTYGDGSCLFQAIAWLIFEDMNRAAYVRQQIVSHVVQNWGRLGVFTLQVVRDVQGHEKFSNKFCNY